MNKFDIDLVYLWVNGNDAEWRKEKEYWQKKLNIPISQDVCDSRYVENGELRFSLRSVLKNLPWIHKIYIVTNGQIPEWLDTNNDKIKIVTHSEIMPKECLPTFNSRAIEACVANIPDLSEHFLLANDDCFVFKPLKPSFFFSKKGKPTVRLRKKHFTRTKLKRSLYIRSIFHSIRLINNKFKEVYFNIPHHNIDAYTKTLYNECKNEFKPEFDKLIMNRFRELSVQRIIFSLFQVAKAKCKLKIIPSNKHRNIDSATFNIINSKKLYKQIYEIKPALFCINDEPTAHIQDRANLKYMLNALFPNKAPWEKFETITQNNAGCIFKPSDKTFLENIFSIKNKYDNNIATKEITILGLTVKHKLFDLKKIRKNYEKVLKKLRQKYIKKEKIKVVFISQEEQKWTYDSLYRKLKQSEYFEPMVVIYPRSRNLLDDKNADKILQKQYNFYKKRNINVEIGYKNKKFINIKKFKPDIIFYMQRFDLRSHMRPYRTSKYALNMFCSYGYEIEDLTDNYTETFHSWLYAYFVEHQLNKERYKTYSPEGYKNCIVTGYPRLDVYLKDETIDASKYWKEPEKYKIIYAPHHSILEHEIIHCSTFLENGKFILELAKKHPETTWIFKPHMILNFKLIKNGFMTEKDIEQYYNEWEKYGSVYTSGDYFGIFKTSDLMITDCSSFLAEYLPTKKPVIKLLNKDRYEHNPLGQKICSEYYTISDNEQLEKVFNEVVIKRNDYKKQDREKVANEIFNFVEPASNKIYEYIIQELKN